MSGIADVLESLRDADGLLRVENVLAAAANPESPLHDHVNWNDAEASHLYRLGQVRELIRAQKISVRIGPVVIRAVTYVPTPDRTGAYQRLDEIPPASALARAVMLGELARVEGALGRAKSIAATLGLSDEIDNLIEAVTMLRARTAPPSSAGLSGTA